MLGGAEINRYRAFIILVTVEDRRVVTWVMMYRTSFGTQVRAIIRKPRRWPRPAASTWHRVNALTFAFGSGLAGAAGVMDNWASRRLLLPGHGHADGRRRLCVVVVEWSASAARSGRCFRRASSVRLTGWSRPATTTSWPERCGVWGGDHDHYPQAQRPACAEGALSDVRVSVASRSRAIYLAFFALIMRAPLLALLDPFWLNRIAKYLVFGMLGVAMASSGGATAASSIWGRACFSVPAPTCWRCRR